MADDSGFMDWSPCGLAQDLSAHTSRPYYRALAMPGGFPLTPHQPSATVFKRVRPSTDDGPILNASKRACTVAARAASAFTVTANSMTAILRNMNMPRLPFRARRSRQAENRRTAITAVSINDSSSEIISQSPPGSKLLPPKEAHTPGKHTSQLTVEHKSTIKIRSPFPVATPNHAAFTRNLSQSPSGGGILMSKEAQTLQHNIPALKIEPPSAIKLRSPFPVASPSHFTSTSKESQSPRDVKISMPEEAQTSQHDIPESKVKPQSTTNFRSLFPYFAPEDAVSTSKQSQSPPGLEALMPRETQTSSPNVPAPVAVRPPVVTLRSPFPILEPTNGKHPASPRHIPDSSPARQLAAELDVAAEESDSSSTFDGNWVPTTPITQIQKPTIPTTPLSSAVPDTADWYHDGIKWTLHSDFTKSPSEHSATKSRAEVLEEGQGSSRQTRRSILKAKIALGDTSKFDIKPLSDEWEAKVNQALKNGHGRLQARDFQKIVPPVGKGGIDAWLNDESINEYLQLVTKHANKDVKPKTAPRMHAFSTFFFTSLRDGGYKKVARWAKRANLAGVALLDVEKIFIPINPSQSHWTLAVIQPRIQCITHYNSYGSGSKAYLDVICEWLKGELGAGFNKDDWVLDTTTESPQQTNGSDCGVFTVTTAKQIMLGISPLAYGPADIPTQRRRMVAELVNGDLLQIGN
jgi:hypothetical protein